ncbi:hypothetical protein IQ268_00700 [Oculatella sp. LEGE 06141]|nr:hypothetical protein [Oculatella sp. LEGE 06141]
MITDKSVGDRQSHTSGQSRPFQRDVGRAQTIIYEFLLEIVNTWPPEAVLKEFKQLFIHHTDTISSSTLPSLYEIVFSNHEEEFLNTLKRSCYILINNWDLIRNRKPIRDLIQLFHDPIIHRPTVSPTLKRLRTWLCKFVNSQDFQELQLFATRYDIETKTHWTERYTSYLLVSQYVNLDNPIEQRRAARALSIQLREKFKFDLAMYSARSQSAKANPSIFHNPTGLGDEALRLIKAIVARRGTFSYVNLANIFINQTQNLSYQDFKQSLVDYLAFSVMNNEFTSTLKKQLSDKLSALYPEHHQKPLSSALLLRTCNRVIEYLTTEDHYSPAPLFITLLTKSGPITPVIILLKTILICPYTRTQLEARIAELIRYYQEYPEEDCQWIVNFFEVFSVTTAIYTENVEYSLVHMDRQYTDHPQEMNWKAYLDTCRIFSQMKHNGSPVQDLELLETKALDVLPEELEQA